MKGKKDHGIKHDAKISRPQEEGAAPASEIDELTAKLQEKEKEAAANYDKFVRMVADFDNYKKRAAKDKTDTIKFANEELIKDILPFMDSLDRAMEHTGSAELDSFKDGIKLIQDQLLCCLKKHGVEKIESVGGDFDPNYHEAMMHMHSNEHEDNKVINEIATGYLLNGRLLRPSKVCVCKRNNKEKDTNDINADNEE
ncbi:MAG: nucleotide exchange factor GrpE [Syntrophaceae bacterium]|nr:nucleotide exchange factor GrpE [Syntrophaceae bacterium]